MRLAEPSMQRANGRLGGDAIKKKKKISNTNTAEYYGPIVSSKLSPSFLGWKETHT